MMMATKWIGCSVILAMVLGGTTLLQAADTSADHDSYQEGMDAIAAKRYQTAITDFQQFISSSVGDPRVEKAQKLLRDCVVAMAKQDEATEREADAAAIYLQLANDPATPADQKEGYRKQAAQALMTGFTDAQQKHQLDRVLSLNRAWAKMLPEKASLLTQEQIESLTNDAVAGALQDKLNLLAMPDVLADYYPGQDVPWAELAKRNHNEPPQSGYFKALAEVEWAGRYLSEYDRLDKDSPLRSDKNFITQTDKMFLRRAEMWCSQGNLPAAQTAIEAAKSGLMVESDQALLKVLEQKFAPRFAAMKPERPNLEFAGPVQGKASWNDSGDGFGMAKDVVLDEGAEVTIKPGFLLDGGKIEIMKADLHLHGMPQQPIVFRHVTLSGQIGSHMDADNAVFIDCVFEKDGHDSAKYYTTKWTFSNCLLYRSKFAGLRQVDYGIKMTNSAVVESILPEREAKGSDLAAAYSGRWDQAANCFFFRTLLGTSAIWMTSKCNFVHCALAKADEFKSKTTLSIPLFAPEGDRLAGALRNDTLVSDVGDVRYGFGRKPFDNALPAFWALLPAELPDVIQDRNIGETNGG